MAGARRAQRELDEQRGVALRVLVVWFEMYEGDERAAWRPSLLADDRAIHYWDPKKAIGSWYADSAPEFRRSGDVLWDAWLLYEPGARAADRPLAWGRTIVATQKQLAEALAKVAAAKNR